MRSEWQQDFDLYVKRGGHFVIRLLQDCYTARGDRIPAYGIDSIRYTDLGKASPKPLIELPSKVDFRGKKVLVVDDVADEATTLIAIKDKILASVSQRVEMRFMTLYRKPWAKLIPHYWAEETDKWINFPWEPYEVLGQIIRRDLPIAELANEAERAGFHIDEIRAYLRVLNVSLKAGSDLRSRTEELIAFVQERHGNSRSEEPNPVDLGHFRKLVDAPERVPKHRRA
jgi:hypoxanthine phosphoribosyltransferase